MSNIIDGLVPFAVGAPKLENPGFITTHTRICIQTHKISTKDSFHYFVLIALNNDHFCTQIGRHNVTGPPGALLFDVKPEIALKESLKLLF